MVICDCCGIEFPNEPDEDQGNMWFCSIECAVYSGKFSVIEGFINNDEPVKKMPPKNIKKYYDE